MLPRGRHSSAIHGTGNIPANIVTVQLPPRVLLQDIFDARGKPILLVLPPCPAGQRMVFVFGQHGGLHWYNVDTQQIYTHSTLTKNVPRIVSSTLHFPPKDRTKRSEQKAGNTRVVLKCPGKMIPAVQHDHPRVIDHAVLRYHLYDMAMRSIFTLHWDELRTEQVRLFADFFCPVFIGVPFLQVGIRLFHKKFKNLGETSVM